MASDKLFKPRNSYSFHGICNFMKKIKSPPGFIFPLDPLKVDAYSDRHISWPLGQVEMITVHKIKLSGSLMARLLI